MVHAHAYVQVCYAIIMLTTNLHNPKVKAKMVVHEFRAAERGCQRRRQLPGRLPRRNLRRHPRGGAQSDAAVRGWQCTERDGLTIHLAAGMFVLMDP